MFFYDYVLVSLVYCCINLFCFPNNTMFFLTKTNFLLVTIILSQVLKNEEQFPNRAMRNWESSRIENNNFFMLANWMHLFVFWWFPAMHSIARYYKIHILILLCELTPSQNKSTLIFVKIYPFFTYFTIMESHFSSFSSQQFYVCILFSFYEIKKTHCETTWLPPYVSTKNER